jgi:hypothetical protein
MSTHHGQSDHTPAKQQQLKELLQACRYAWSSKKEWTHPHRIFIDCMAGSGHAEDGSPGSPIILQDYANSLPESFCVWCDLNRHHVDQLQVYSSESTVILVGR